MRRNLLLVAATSSILSLAAPALAPAQGRHHHHGGRNANSHRRGHRAHALTFGGSLGGASSGTAPTAGTPSSGAPAGTVAAFTEGVLTIKLTDISGGGKVTEISGKVTEGTELQCEPAAGAGDDEDRSEGGDDAGRSTQTEDSAQLRAMARSSDMGDDMGEGEDEGETCTTAALKPAAVVLRAELLIGENGAVWKKIELQK